MSIAESQHRIDLRIRKQQQDLYVELHAYHKLKNAWGLGYIRWSARLSGHYVDIEKRKREVFLGNSPQQAHQRLNHVKSFL